MIELINSEKEEILPEKLKQELIVNCLVKYKDYGKYLTEDFFKGKLEEFIEIYNAECGISPEVYFQIFVNKKSLVKLSKYIRNNDIDLEIELISKYTNLVRYILTKMNIELPIDTEKVLMKSLETYNGNKPFPLYILDNVKESISNHIIKEVNESDCSNFNKQENHATSCGDHKIEINLDTEKNNKERGAKMSTKNNSRNDYGTRIYFLEYFPYNSCDEVIDAISHLPDIYQKLLRKAYGDDYKHPLANSIDRRDQMFIKTNIVLKVEELLRCMKKCKRKSRRKSSNNISTKKSTNNINEITSKSIDEKKEDTPNTNNNQDDSPNNVNNEFVEQPVTETIVNESIINQDTNILESNQQEPKLVDDKNEDAINTNNNQDDFPNNVNNEFVEQPVAETIVNESIINQDTNILESNQQEPKQVDEKKEDTINTNNNQDDSQNNVDKEIIEKSGMENTDNASITDNSFIVTQDASTIINQQEEQAPTDISDKKINEEIIQIFNNPIFIEIARKKSIKELLIVALRLGYINNRCFMQEDIATFLGMDVAEVNAIFKSVLIDYKTKLNNVIDQVIELETVPSVSNKKYIKLLKSSLQDK
mgnify:CR=1 FL=1